MVSTINNVHIYESKFICNILILEMHKAFLFFEDLTNL